MKEWITLNFCDLLAGTILWILDCKGNFLNWNVEWKTCDSLATSLLFMSLLVISIFVYLKKKLNYCSSVIVFSKRVVGFTQYFCFIIIVTRMSKKYFFPFIYFCLLQMSEIFVEGVWKKVNFLLYHMNIIIQQSIVII